jgi:hypothetical protein
MRRPATEYTPEAFHEIELGTIAGQPIQLEMRMRSQHLGNPGGLRPGAVSMMRTTGLPSRAG